MTPVFSQAPSNTWIRALTAHPAATVIDLATRLTPNWQVSYETLPQTGLSLLQLQDGVFHEPYYLGEIPLSTAWITLTADDGTCWQGAAQVMSDVADLASALAICDAVLTHQLTGWQQVATLVEQGLAVRQQEDAVRGAMLARTRVNFSLLSQEEADDPD